MCSPIQFVDVEAAEGTEVITVAPHAPFACCDFSGEGHGNPQLGGGILQFGLTQYLSEPSQSVKSRMRGAGPGSPPFTIDNDMDKTALDLGIRVDMLSDSGFQLSLIKQKLSH